MDKLLEILYKRGVGDLIDLSRNKLMQKDTTYQHDLKDLLELEGRYEQLGISLEHRIMIGVKQLAVQLHNEFVETIKNQKTDLTRLLRRKPLYAREDLAGLTDLPLQVVSAIVQIEIPEVYTEGGDVAYPKELQERMAAFLEERLYQGMNLEEKEELKQSFIGKRENRAMEFMLQIENDERNVLKRAGNLNPELLNEVQREAVKRMNSKEIREQTLSRENAKVLREQRMDKRMEQEVEW